MVWLVPLALIVLLLAYVGVAIMLRWAQSNSIFDLPNERSSHTRPTPRGGGLIFLLVTLAGTAVAVLFVPGWSLWQTGAYLLGAVLIAIVSWLDDLNRLPMSSAVRFGAHFIGALLLLVAFGAPELISLPLLGQLSIGWLGLPIALIWLVGLTNAWNFMDGIDGIAASGCVVASGGWVAVGLLTDQQMVTVVALLLGASTLGFLGHNWSPARIFMGDVGSAFLGFTLAAFTVIAAQKEPAAALAGVLFVWPFLFDTGFTFFTRLIKRENVFAAHRSHRYQRLVIAGWSHAAVSLLYVVLSIMGVAGGLAWLLGVPGSGIAIVIVYPVLAVLLCLLVKREEKKHSNHRPLAVTARAPINSPPSEPAR